MRNILVSLYLLNKITSGVFAQGSGYFIENGVNATIIDKHPQTQFEFEEVLHYYRTDVRKREPQFIGFDIQDDNLEIDMEIAVPFLSVPTKKSLSNNQKGNFANINVAAMILAAIVALSGTFLGGVARFFRGDGFFNGRPFVRTGSKKHRGEAPSEEYIWDVFAKIENALLEIDFDVRACSQRAICWHVKNSLLNIHENRAGKIDRFIKNVLEEKWLRKLMSDSIWLEAIDAGKKGQSCEETYKTCALNSRNLEKFVSKIQKFAKPKNNKRK